MALSRSVRRVAFVLTLLTRNCLWQLAPIGEKFNPNHHEAIVEVADAAKESGTVAQVFKDGYLIKDRLLRSAMVSVYKKE